MSPGASASLRGFKPWIPALTLGAIVACLFAIRAFRFVPDAYSTDTLYYLAAAARVQAEPTQAFAPDFIGRRHPLFLGVLALVSPSVESGEPPRLGLLLGLTYLGHLASVLLLERLVRATPAGPRAAWLAGFLLAVFGGANNLFADTNHFARTWNLALALLALVAILRGRPWLYLLGYLLTLLNFEDAFLLPLAAIVAVRWLGQSEPGGRAARGPTRHWPHLAALGLLALFVAHAAWATPPSARPLADPTAALGEALRLPLEVAHAALVLRSDLLPIPTPIRLGIAALALALLLLPAASRPPRASREQRLTLAFFGVVTLVFALPYLLRSTEASWPSRYLYFPAAALAGLLGAAVHGSASGRIRIPRSLLHGLALVYLALVGVTTTERATSVIVTRHLHRFTSVAPAQVVARIAAALGREPKHGAWTIGAADCAFLSRVHTPEPLCARPGLERPAASGTLGR